MTNELFGRPLTFGDDAQIEELKKQLKRKWMVSVSASYFEEQLIEAETKEEAIAKAKMDFNVYELEFEIHWSAVED